MLNFPVFLSHFLLYETVELIGFVTRPADLLQDCYSAIVGPAGRLLIYPS